MPLVVLICFSRQRTFLLSSETFSIPRGIAYSLPLIETEESAGLSSETVLEFERGRFKRAPDRNGRVRW